MRWYSTALSASARVGSVSHRVAVRVRPIGVRSQGVGMHIERAARVVFVVQGDVPAARIVHPAADGRRVAHTSRFFAMGMADGYIFCNEDHAFMPSNCSRDDWLGAIMQPQLWVSRRAQNSVPMRFNRHSVRAGWAKSIARATPSSVATWH